MEIDKQPLSINSNKVGIDLGIRKLITFSDGDWIENPQFLKQNEKRLKKLQRSLSRKKKGSKNRNKARILLARHHSYIARSRNDYLHKQTAKITDENQVIIAENLDVQKMMQQNHNLAKLISDASWGEITRQLKYKSEWKGRIYHEVDRFFASSQICNCCGNQNHKLKSEEFWKCKNCDSFNDRDINAAKNILQRGLLDLAGSGNRNPGETQSPKICGDSDNFSFLTETDEPSESTKQEAADFSRR